MTNAFIFFILYLFLFTIFWFWWVRVSSWWRVNFSPYNTIKPPASRGGNKIFFCGWLLMTSPFILLEPTCVLHLALGGMLWWRMQMQFHLLPINFVCVSAGRSWGKAPLSKTSIIPSSLPLRCGRNLGYLLYYEKKTFRLHYILLFHLFIKSQNIPLSA